MNGRSMPSRLVVLLAGNPNSGKTSLFNWMAGAHQHVGNYPGVTVEKKSARLTRDGVEIELVDLPGVYSLLAASPEEAIARDEILSGTASVVIQVLDATNLERNLHLTAQLTEMGVPVAYALNMSDEAARNGLEFDLERMSGLLGGPVVPTNGSTGEGVGALLASARLAAAGGQLCPSRVYYGADLEEVIAAVASQFEGDDAVSARRRAIGLLDGISDPHAPSGAADLAAREAARLEKRGGRPLDVQLAEARYGFALGVVTEVARGTAHYVRCDRTLRLDSLLLHRVWGLPLFVFLMWIVFHLVFTLGEPPMQWIEAGLGALSDGIRAVWPAGTAPLLQSLIVDGVIGGVGGVVSFLPNILLLFLAIAFLEDTGYMARVAFLMDRLMHKMGLHGKSFIPMLIGLGCTVPAILATRMLESRRDRFTTILVTPFVSCGARLTIYALLIPSFFAPRWRGWVLWGLYMAGIAAAIGVARLLRGTVFRGEQAPFVMGLPRTGCPPGARWPSTCGIAPGCTCRKPAPSSWPFPSCSGRWAPFRAIRNPAATSLRRRRFWNTRPSGASGNGLNRRFVPLALIGAWVRRWRVRLPPRKCSWPRWASSTRWAVPAGTIPTASGRLCGCTTRRCRAWR